MGRGVAGLRVRPGRRAARRSEPKTAGLAFPPPVDRVPPSRGAGGAATDIGPPGGDPAAGHRGEGHDSIQWDRVRGRARHARARRRRSGRARDRPRQHEEAAPRGDGQRHPAPRARAAVDRQRQRRHPRVGHARLRGVGWPTSRASSRRPATGRACRSSPSRSSATSREPTLSQVSPTPTDYETATFEYSGSGDVTGKVVPATNNQIPPAGEPGTSPAGCEPGDFPPASATGPGRARPARHVQLRRQGGQRPGRGLRRGDHLQRGPAGPHGAADRHARRAVHDPGGRASPTPTARRSTRPPRRATWSCTSRPPPRTIRTRTTTNLIATTSDRRPRAGGRRRRAPGLRHRGPGHQRQRLRHARPTSRSPSRWPSSA